MPDPRRIRTRLLASILVFACWAGAARSQEAMFVTGISQPGAATLSVAGGPAVPVGMNTSISAGSLHLDSGYVMLLEPSGVVVVLNGASEATLEQSEGEMRLTLRSGNLMVASDLPEAERQALMVAFGEADTGPAVEFLVQPGQTYLAGAPGTVDVMFAPSTEGASLALFVGAQTLSLAGGQVLTLADGRRSSAPADGWVAAHGFGAGWGDKLGVASAQAVRADVEARLFKNIIHWDRRAKSGYVQVRVSEARFNPEIRQVVEIVAPLLRASTRGGAVQTTPFNAANEVPPLSPAALSVQNRNIARGVAVIELNNNARDLLTQTGSRGLGFRGPSRLAIPGFSSPGIRTIGPAGLGAGNP